MNRLTVLLTALFVVVAVFLTQCFFIVNPGEVGVLVSLGKATEQPYFEGFHTKKPFLSSINKIDVKVQKHEVQVEGTSKDLQKITATFAVNFQLDPSKAVQFFRTQGRLEDAVTRVIDPQAEEAFKIAIAERTAEESVTQRQALKGEFDTLLTQRLAVYDIAAIDTSVVDISFSSEFAAAVEAKQVAEQDAQRAVYLAKKAEQEAQAEINLAKGTAEAQRLQAESLKANGGELVILSKTIEAWKAGGSQMPDVLVLGGNEDGKQPPFIFNLPSKSQS